MEQGRLRVWCKIFKGRVELIPWKHSEKWCVEFFHSFLFVVHSLSSKREFNAFPKSRSILSVTNRTRIPRILPSNSLPNVRLLNIFHRFCTDFIPVLYDSTGFYEIERILKRYRDIMERIELEKVLGISF